ncbi:LysR family transcriptional regulator [Streptomyces nojiriensis]|uniref:LysR family transcriptional regulator n=1 Tax=Streptomyces nojiriensis TaxID=66374 RepID=A0ABQ3SNI5_9ACTN|nr:LysR family transcriptional regulator [Streptomyces nojiriensis]QTI43254.1 HTH-type transcriptional regulator GltC [Streptomyces nojiriensis]GGS11659.1 LysR family transcriptional regulator [Streptomyces nojiriensis]GHI69699.1 LysR family transcriptional regulator [Streptomyces nojiriensis]
MLDVRQLQVLRSIAQEGSLAAAGRALHYSQPTITHHLAALEAHVNARLVQRGPRGATLTELGEALLPHAEAVLDRLRHAELEVRNLAERGMRTLHIGTFPTAGALLLAPAVKRLHQQGVHISLTEGELPLLLRGLRAKELHAALVFSQPGDSLDLDEDFEVHPLLSDPLLLVMPQDHPCAAREEVSLGELRDTAWVGAADPHDPCDRVLAWACGQEGYEPLHVMRTDDYAVVQGLVAAGTGVALVPRLALGHPRPDLVVRPLARPDLAREISVAVLRSTSAGAAQELIEALREQAALITDRWAAV